jgi:hypothetical protein
MAVNRDRALVKDIIDHASEAVAISGGRRRGDLDTVLQDMTGSECGKMLPDFQPVENLLHRPAEAGIEGQLRKRPAFNI